MDRQPNWSQSISWTMTIKIYLQPGEQLHFCCGCAIKWTSHSCCHSTLNPPIFVPPKHTLFDTKDDILVPENVKLLLSVFWCPSEHDQHQSTASPRMHISTWENLINCTRRTSLIGIRMQQNYNGMSRALCQILLSFLITHWAHEVIKWVSGWKLITLLHNNPQHIVGFGYVTLKILRGSVPSITWRNCLLRRYCEPSTAPSTVSSRNGVGHRVLTWFFGDHCLKPVWSQYLLALKFLNWN
jgi:hypothetical protein